jgi:hypothetical protein
MLMNLSGIELESEPGLDSKIKLPRLHVEFRDLSTANELERQAMALNVTKKALINDLLELLFSKPNIFSELLIKDIAAMLAVFKQLPMEQICHLAETSHRTKEQMVVHLIIKGISVYESLRDSDPD